MIGSPEWIGIDLEKKDRTCGVPLFFDLYGAGKTNELQISAHGNANVQANKKCTVSPKIVGLDNYEHYTSYSYVRKWVEETAEKNAKLVDLSSIKWRDKIPPAVGDFILEHCSDLIWGVDITFTCNKQTHVGKVRFRGLRWEDIGHSRRRRILYKENGNC